MPWTYLESATPLAMAHRGGSLEAPQNTMSAFENAANLGFRYFELDVRATSDGVLAVYHDPTLDTLTNSSGAIAELTWAEVCQAKLSGSEPIPRLEEVLETWPEIRVNIDPKHSAAVAPLATVLQQRDCSERVCLSTFSDRRMVILKRLLGKRYCTAGTQLQIAKLRAQSLLQRRGESADGGELMESGKSGEESGKNPASSNFLRPSARTQGCVQVPATIHGWRLVDARFVETVHSHGFQVHVWTVNEEAEMRDLLKLGADGIMTDRPALLKDVLLDLGLWTN